VNVRATLASPGCPALKIPSAADRVRAKWKIEAREGRRQAAPRKKTSARLLRRAGASRGDDGNRTPFCVVARGSFAIKACLSSVRRPSRSAGFPCPESLDAAGPFDRRQAGGARAAVGYDQPAGRDPDSEEPARSSRLETPNSEARWVTIFDR